MIAGEDLCSDSAQAVPKNAENPYEVRITDQSETTSSAASSLCPDFPGKLQIRGSMDEADALRLAARCKPMEVRDPKTGKPPNNTAGWLIIFGPCGLAVWALGLSLIMDIRSGSFTVDRILFWLTTVAIPGASVIALILLFRRFRFRYEDADPAVGATTEIELTSKWYTVERTTRAGKPSHSRFLWSATDVQSSKDAWLLNHGGVNPVLILRDWLTPDQQGLVDQFATDLMQWRTYTGPQQKIEDLPRLFPPLPADGIRYTISRAQHEEFHKILPLIDERFPDMPRASRFYQPWLAKLWGTAVFLSAMTHPIHSYLTGNAIGIGWLFGSLLGCFIYWMGTSSSRNSYPEYGGIITESEIWTETKTFQHWFELRHFDRCELLDNVLLLSSEKSKSPSLFVQSAFESEAEWQAAVHRIEAAVKSPAGK